MHNYFSNKNRAFIKHFKRPKLRAGEYCFYSNQSLFVLLTLLNEFLEAWLLGRSTSRSFSGA